MGLPPVAVSNPTPQILPSPQTGVGTSGRTGGWADDESGTTWEGQPETDWEAETRRIYDANPEWGDLPKQPNEEEEMAQIDWGDVITGVAGQIFNPQPQTSFTPAPYPFMPTGPGGFGGPGVSTPGTYIDKHGNLCKRRRRRRRLLTPTDLSDLAALATIVGKGDALKLATVKAVRR